LQLTKVLPHVITQSKKANLWPKGLYMRGKSSVNSQALEPTDHLVVLLVNTDVHTYTVNQMLDGKPGTTIPMA
jgi:hypothetical protein